MIFFLILVNLRKLLCKTEINNRRLRYERILFSMLFKGKKPLRHYHFLIKKRRKEQQMRHQVLKHSKTSRSTEKEIL